MYKSDKELGKPGQMKKRRDEAKTDTEDPSQRQTQKTQVKDRHTRPKSKTDTEDPSQRQTQKTQVRDR